MRIVSRVGLVLAALDFIASPAQAMSVAEFLTKADAMRAKGLLAMGSRDVKLLGAEMRAIGTAYRADLDGAKKAGRPPHSCPPPKARPNSTAASWSPSCARYRPRSSARRA